MHNTSLTFAVLACAAFGSVACSDKPKSRMSSNAAKIDCSKDENQDKDECKGAGSSDPTGDAAGVDTVLPDFLAGVKPLDDDEAVQFFLDTCVSCHDAKNGSVRSFWPLDKDTFSKQALTIDTQAPTVYFALLMKGKAIVGGQPPAMPPTDLKPEQKDKLLSLIKWMQIEMPAAVDDAMTRYGGGVKDASLGVGVVLDFKCSEPATFREYIRRITNDAFAREPTESELKLGSGQTDDKVTTKDRQTVADRLFSDPAWKLEFEAKGLRKFADKVSGSADIKAYEPAITAAQAEDLKQEFYQILKKNYETESFRDILLSDKTMVSTKTAPLYGCADPGAEWGECPMPAPRGSYFSTFSYLRSKPSSFLRDNNNYGRAALMYFVVRGDVFRAAFDQDGGAETVKPLPACLKTKDFRGKKGAAIAWRGAGAVPSSANLCQSCHIQRQMAAGSILFRHYNVAGMLFGSQAAADATDPDFAAATAPEVVNKPNLTGPEQVVNQAFLQSLLDDDGTEQACVPAEDNNGTDLILKTVKDLATYLIGDGSVLAGGLSRHLPRAMSNLDNTSEEIIVKINQAFADGGGKLAPVFKAYFASETYSCKR